MSDQVAVSTWPPMGVSVGDSRHHRQLAYVLSISPLELTFGEKSLHQMLEGTNSPHTEG